MYVKYAAYRKGRPIGNIAIEEISELLKDPEIFVWLALFEPDDAELSKIQEEFGLHHLAMDDARAAHQRPKLEEYGECLFLVLHPVALNDDGFLVGETHMFVGRQFFVSIRHGQTEGYRRVRERCESTPHLLAKGSGFALYALLDFVVDQFMPVVAHYQRLLEQLEADIFDQRPDYSMIARLYELKREAALLHDAAVPLLDICNALQRLHPEIVTKDLHAYYRDVHDHVLRILRGLEAMKDALSDAMQVNLALVTVRQNEVVKRLAGWGAILAIPTMVFSLYGMNFKRMPELEWSFGYPVALAVTVVGCVLLYWRLKRSQWL